LLIVMVGYWYGEVVDGLSSDIGSLFGWLLSRTSGRRQFHSTIVRIDLHRLPTRRQLENEGGNDNAWCCGRARWMMRC